MYGLAADLFRVDSTITSGCKCIDTVQPQMATCPTGFPTPLANIRLRTRAWSCPGGIGAPGARN
ncbi:MAG: hypothetical protein R3D66_01995 [Alphaproteobacteria bacterium]